MGSNSNDRNELAELMSDGWSWRECGAGVDEEARAGVTANTTAVTALVEEVEELKGTTTEIPFERSGETVTFTPADDSPINVVVEIACMQNGTGNEPTITNPWPIIGVDEVVITHKNNSTEKVYTVTFPEKGYVGTLDVVNGKLTLTHKMIERAVANMNVDENYPGWSGVTELTECFDATHNGAITDFVSNVALYIAGSSRVLANMTGGRNHLTLSKYTFGTQSEIKATYPDLVMQFLIPLLKPRVLDVPPQQIITLPGTNRISASSGDVTVSGTEEVKAFGSGPLDPDAFGLPVLKLVGNCTGMTKDDYVPLTFTFQGRSGTVQVKKQGTSSIGVGQEIGAGFDDDLGGLFNFTLKFPEAFEAKEGWGAHDKYCFKANAIDHSHLRNVGGAKLWGQIVKTRAGLHSTIYPSPTIGPGSYKDYYTYENGVYTAPTCVTTANVGRYCINGFTVPAGQYNVLFDALLPAGSEDLTIRASLYSATGNQHYALQAAEAGVWCPMGIVVEAQTLTGDCYLSIQAQTVNNLQFRNVRLLNKVTNETIPLPPPAWQIRELPNAGAIDGFPCTIVLNGKYYMTGTFNIPKDGWMYSMGNGDREAILCAEGTDNCFMTGTASVGTDYELEYVSDEDNAGWVQTSLDTLINAVANSDGTDLNTTIAQYLDWDSAIDMMIFLSLIGGFDLKKKNYLLVTYDGMKWMMGAYDMDSIWGNWWTGKEFFSSTNDSMTSIEKLTQHRLYYLIRHHKLNAFKARYAELRASVLSESNVEKTLTNLAAGMPSALLDANAERWPKLRSTNANNLEQILNWYRLRCQAIDAEVASLSVSPDARPEEYALIESITLTETAIINRMEEPDGTPYKFKKVLVKSTMPAGNALKATYTYFRSNGTAIGRAYMGGIQSQTVTMYRIDTIEQKDGYWDTRYYDWTSSVDAIYKIDFTYVNTRSVKMYNAITQVQISQEYPAGATVEIWGVRA